MQIIALYWKLTRFRVYQAKQKHTYNIYFKVYFQAIMLTGKETSITRRSSRRFNPPIIIIIGRRNIYLCQIYVSNSTDGDQQDRFTEHIKNVYFPGELLFS